MFFWCLSIFRIIFFLKKHVYLSLISQRLLCLDSIHLLNWDLDLQRAGPGLVIVRASCRRQNRYLEK